MREREERIDGREKKEETKKERRKRERRSRLVSRNEEKVRDETGLKQKK